MKTTLKWKPTTKRTAHHLKWLEGGSHPYEYYSITSQKLWCLLLKLPLRLWFLKPFTCIALRQPQEASKNKRQLTVVELNSKMARIHRPSCAPPPIPLRIPRCQRSLLLILQSYFGFYNSAEEFYDF